MTNKIEKLTSSIENKLQFIITIFTIMVGVVILKGNTNTEFYFVISILLLDYILFSAIKDYNFKLTELSLKLLNGSIIAGIAAYIVPFYTIAIQTQSSLHFGQGYFLIGTGAVSAFLMALFPIIFLVLLIIYWIKDNI